ncbi:MAG: hypothetical protein CMC07_08410 [Flavobacteriaceae bacterium]|nr:hypothetical protein [Flavobacteriaceae bacterium]|tara:strand:- start:3415 stop:3702 length:288 start_codon:yes stop_codon:yes gene_type:complete
MDIFLFLGNNPMKYTYYFSDRIRNDGVPKLNQEQFRRMMNIVFVEGMLTAFNQPSVDRIDLMHKRYRDIKSLNELTKRLRPEILYDQMKRLSEKK